MLCFGLFTLFFGPLGDRFGKTRILKLAAMGSAVASLASAFSPNLNVIIVIRAINGAFSAGVMPISMAYIGETSPQHEMHSRIGKVMGLMFLGSALATVIGGTVSQLGSWRMVYLVYGFAELLLVIPLFLLLPTDSTVKNSSIGSGYKELLRTPGFLKTVGLLFFIGFSTLGTFAYLGEYLRQLTGYGLIRIGWILGAYGIGTLLGGRIAAELRMKIGKAFYFLAGLTGGIGFTFISFSSTSAYIAVAGLFLAGLAFISLQSSIVFQAQNLAPMRRGAVMSAASFTMVTSAALGTFLNGKIFAIMSDGLLYCAAGAFLTAGLLATLVLLFRKPGGQNRPSSIESHTSLKT